MRAIAVREILLRITAERLPVTAAVLQTVRVTPVKAAPLTHRVRLATTPTGRLPQIRAARTISVVHLRHVLITPRHSAADILYLRSSAGTLRRLAHTPHRNSSAPTLRHPVLTPRRAARIRRHRMLPRLLATDRPAVVAAVEAEVAQDRTAAKPQLSF
jgi:hypothetical protein